MKVNKTLGLSIISVVLSIVLLAGTTFAWFTDTVENEDNVIQIGNLKVDLEKYEADAASDDGEDAEHNDHYVSIAGKTGSLFDDTLWAPGTMQIVYLKAQNEGNLALDYSFILNVNVPEGQATNPADAFKYAIIDDAEYGDLDGKNWTDIETAVGADKVVALEEGIEPLKTDVQLPAGESDYFALVLYMKDVDNDYQNGELEIDVQLAAKQSVLENGAFGNGFDSYAAYGAEMWLPVVQPEQPGPQEPEYLLKWDFEGTSPVWYVAGDSTQEQKYISYEEKSGNKYVTFGETLGQLAWIGTIISGDDSGFEKGRTYTVSCKIKNEVAEAGVGEAEDKGKYARPVIYLCFGSSVIFDISSGASTDIITVGKGEDFEQYNATFTVPEDWDGKQVTIGMYNIRYKKDEYNGQNGFYCGNILIDDFVISPVTE